MCLHAARRGRLLAACAHAPPLPPPPPPLHRLYIWIFIGIAVYLCGVVLIGVGTRRVVDALNATIALSIWKVGACMHRQALRACWNYPVRVCRGGAVLVRYLYIRNHDGSIAWYLPHVR